DGKVFIENGFMFDQGRSVPWFQRCPVNAAPPAITELDFLALWQGCEQEKDSKQAVKQCSALLELLPTSPLAHFHRGLAYSRTGDHAKAIVDYTEAIQNDPFYVAAYNNRAWSTFSTGKAAEALPDVERALQLWPNYAAAIDTRAQILETLGRKDDAI